MFRCSCTPSIRWPFDIFELRKAWDFIISITPLDESLMSFLTGLIYSFIWVRPLDVLLAGAVLWAELDLVVDPIRAVPTHFSVQWWRGASSKLTSATPRRQRPTWPLVNLQRCQSVCQLHQGTRQPRNPPLLSSFGMSGEATVRRQLWVKRCEDGVFSFRRALSLATTGKADKCDRCDLVLDQGVNWSGAQDGPSCCSRLLQHRARPGPRAALPYILPLP